MASLTRLVRVAILCSTCRLSSQSVVSTFDSDTGANLRLKLAVASIGLSLFREAAAGFFSLAMRYKLICGTRVSRLAKKV